MFDCKLRIFKSGEKEIIPNPRWEKIKSVLDRVDGYNLSSLSLLLEGKGDIKVAGGDKINGVRLYHVSYYPEDYSYDLNLVNTSVSREAEEYIKITVEGVGVHQDAVYLVEYKDMIKAVKHFFETGELTEDQEWE